MSDGQEQNLRLLFNIREQRAHDERKIYRNLIRGKQSVDNEVRNAARCSDYSGNIPSTTRNPTTAYLADYRLPQLASQGINTLGNNYEG